MPEYYTDTLANGVRLVTVPMPHLHSAELVCSMSVGGRCEPTELAGISHFLEHMIFRGTAEYATSIDLERAFEAIGGSVNASTDMETTCFHSQLHPDFLAEGVALFASMLRRPRFNDIDIERRIILEEAREDFNEDGVQINHDNLMVNLLWPEHPLGESLIGSTETLHTIDRAKLEAYYRSWYIPENLVICACGPIARETFRQSVANEFGDWPARKSLPILPAPEKMDEEPQSLWVQDSDSQISLQLAFRLPGRKDERTLAVRMLRRILSWGGGARLSVRLREELGLTYSVEANCSFLDDTGYMAIDLSVSPENLQPAVIELFKILVELRNRPIPADELSAVTRSYLFDLEFSRDQSEAMAVRYGWGLQTDYIRTLQQDCHELQQLTPAALQKVAKEMFCSTRMKLVVVGPWTEVDRRKIDYLLQHSGL
ncbi:pitrilysin family protein [uncultured Desulfuromusa sp.]|uniref:M16 family metallopeptidase n=1 Tax=uncultured Desulfuromusa sp. TaxID=219183 RepID=UPI002AA6F3CC|nr:pitrilysin family protein [uncultured Desulfuromusa sp.]